jgi:hypothetical protein
MTREHLHGWLLVESWTLFVVNLPHACGASLESACAFDACEEPVTEFERRWLHNPIVIMVHNAHVAGSKRPAVHDTSVMPFELSFEKSL